MKRNAPSNTAPEFLDWLLDGPPEIRYRTLVDLQGQSEDNPAVIAARKDMLAAAPVRALLSDLAAWPGRALKGHNDASHLLHKLVFIADLGLRARDPGIDAIIEKVLAHQSPEGAFQILANVPVRYCGTGQDQLVWMLCDAPSVLYALVKLGLAEDERVETAIRHLVNLGRNNGWPCAVAPELGKFRGPGRKTDPCPYATLLALKALARFPEWRDSGPCFSGAEALLQLWEQRKERRPYMFAMGTDFARLKAPMVWYDILHVVEVLTQFPWLRRDARLQEMLDILKTKADAQGRFTAGSVWKAWSGWEFGQKKTPSRWLTLKAIATLKRAASAWLPRSA